MSQRGKATLVSSRGKSWQINFMSYKAISIFAVSIITSAFQIVANMENQFYERINLMKSRVSTSTDLKQSQLNNSNCLIPKPSDWKERVKHKAACTVFHKRGQSGSSKVTASKVSNLEAFSVGELKQQLNNRDKYLQELIERIVENEQQHKKQMNVIDSEYQSQIDELHQMLQAAIEKNRILEEKLNQDSRRSPRMSNQSLLLSDFR